MGTDVNDGIAAVKRRIQDLPLSRGDTIVFDLRLQPDGGVPGIEGGQFAPIGMRPHEGLGAFVQHRRGEGKRAVRDGDVIGVTQDMMVDHEIGAGNLDPEVSLSPKERIPRTVE